MGTPNEVGIEKHAELRVKHLEMIQGVISRMGTQAAALKNYCVTLTTTVCGFAITLHRPSVAILALLPIIAFSCLDARFLWYERGFRARFERTRLEPITGLPSFEISISDDQYVSYFRTFSSWSIGWFYAPLAAGVVIIAEIINGAL